MAVERCPAIKDGQQCNLVAGHAGQHQLPPDPGWGQVQVAAPVVAGSPPGRVAPKPIRRGRLIILGLVVVAVVAIGVLRGPITSNSAPAGLSDSALKAAMAENINRFSDSTAAIPRDANGAPDIAVKDAVLIVNTLDPGSASDLCRTIAAITNDSNTSKPLGIIGVAVISSGKNVATCSP